jgi:phosphatidylinositol alpha-1,6-mannosyltransferase
MSEPGKTEEPKRTHPPRLLLLTRNFPPLVGGMERLNRHLVEELVARYSVRLIAPRGSGAHAPSGVALDEVPLSPLPLFLARAWIAALRRAREERPALVLAGSALTAPLAWTAARLAGARSTAYVHGLDVAVRHPLYRALWLPFVRRLDLVIANSEATAAAAHAVGVALERIAVVPPGTDLPDRDPEARTRFRTRHGLSATAPILLFVGRLTARKGLRTFVEEVLPSLVAARPDTLLVVVGEPPRRALHAHAETPEAILATARALGLEDRIRFLGNLFGRDLDDAYGGADLHVFPVRHDPTDPEGFGMVAIEAAARGLPTVAYATGGVNDAVADGVSGRLVPPGDARGLAKAALELLERPPSDSALRAHAARFSWPLFGARVRAALDPAFAPLPADRNPPPAERIGTITVTFRPNPALLLNQLRSLPTACVKVIVENTPHDERRTDLGPLLEDVPGAVLVESAGNRGLAAGLDLGVRILRTRAPETTHVLFLDQDSEPRAGLVDALATGLTALEGAGRRPGAVGPRLLDATTGQTHALHVLSGWRWRRPLPPEAGALPVPVTTLNGSGLFMRRALYEELGGFDTSLFIDHVDTEWSFRLRAAGRTLWCVPNALLVHRMGTGSVRFGLRGRRIWPLRSAERHRTLFRNTLRLLRRREIPRVWKFWAAVKLALTALVHTLFDPERFTQLRAMARGLREGLRPSRGFPAEALVVRPHSRPYAEPIRATSGEVVVPDFEKRTSVAGWVWCTGHDGRSGWVPERWLHRVDKGWRIERDYDAAELTLAPGERLLVTLEESGFFWSLKPNGESGWVPSEVVTLKKLA